MLDDIINTANELVFRAVNAIEEGLGAASAENLGFKLSKATSASLKTEQARKDALQELKQNEIDNGIVKLESLLNATVDKDFDKFEIYTLRNILAVGHEEEDLASWVRLDHYKDIHVVDASTSLTPEAVQLQRQKLHELGKLNSMLKAEEAKNAAVLAQLSALLSADVPGGEDAGAASATLAFLDPKKQGSSDRKLTQSTQYALNQLPALQQLLMQLKHHVETAPISRQSRNDDEDTAEGRRRRYIDAQSRRALERGGFDPSSTASTGLAAGRKFGNDELEGIEAIARAFGTAGKPTKPIDADMTE